MVKKDLRWKNQNNQSFYALWFKSRPILVTELLYIRVLYSNCRVSVTPTFPPDQMTEMYTWAGNTRNITCHVLADPSPEILWLHFRQRLDNNATYRIYRMSDEYSNLQVNSCTEDISTVLLLCLNKSCASDVRRNVYLCNPAVCWQI